MLNLRWAFDSIWRFGILKCNFFGNDVSFDLVLFGIERGRLLILEMCGQLLLAEGEFGLLGLSRGARFKGRVCFRITVFLLDIQCLFYLLIYLRALIILRLF